MFQEEGPKAEKDQEPTIERFVLGMRKLKVSEVGAESARGSRTQIDRTQTFTINNGLSSPTMLSFGVLQAGPDQVRNKEGGGSEIR